MILMKKRPLFCFAAFFGAGVIGAYLLNPPPVWMLLCGALLGILALGLALPGRRKLTAAALTASRRSMRPVPSFRSWPQLEISIPVSTSSR